MTNDEARAALREKIVKLYSDKWSVTDAWLADAAIDVVLEEAARVAEKQEDYTSPRPNGVLRRSIAAAIRALKGKL